MTIRTAGVPLRRLAPGVAAAGLLMLLYVIAGVPPALAQDETAIVPPDSALKSLNTTYDTSYDRDRSRGQWRQTLSYGTTTKRSSFNITGDLTTMDFLKVTQKSTVGHIDASLNMFTVGSLLAIVTGSFDMNSINNGGSGLDSRDNHLNLKLQQLMHPANTLRMTVAAYSEVQQKHDKTRNDEVRQGAYSDTARVDSTAAERDSSYTTSIMSGVSGDMTWGTLKGRLQLHTMTQAYQINPTITSFNRTFVHPIDSSATTASYLTETRQRTSGPTGNAGISQRAAYSGIKKTNITLYGERRHQAQSYFDKQRSRQETVRFDNTVGTFHIDTSLLPRIVVNTDASLSRVLNRYKINPNFTQLTRSRGLTSMVNYADSTRRLGVTYTLDRSRTELQASSNGVHLNRMLSSNGWMKVSGSLALDAVGSASLLSDAYENNKNDRDIARTFVSAGCGYRLAPTCSTTVHLSRSSGHTVYIDPSASGSNAVQTTYQLLATLRYAPNRNFSIIQSYVVSADYRILDYAERQNYLVRARRIDTDMADTLWNLAFFHIAHNFVFQDQGTYARFDNATERLYQVATRNYDQILTATAGLKIAPGVVFSAMQGLVNQRALVLASDAGTVQNTWKLNVGVDVTRSFDDGLGVQGAVRRVEEYLEHATNDSQTRRDWIAGVSIHKQF